MREGPHTETPLHGGLSLTHIHKCSHVGGNAHTHMDSVPHGGTETGVRSGHNRKCSTDYIKRIDSLLRMNFGREVEAFTPPVRQFQQSCAIKE